MNKWLDDYNGKFQGRVRQILSFEKVKQGMPVAFRRIIVEVSYNTEIASKLGIGQLLAVETLQDVTGKRLAIYEVNDIIPYHYASISISREDPPKQRMELMDLINKEWKSDASRNSWIEVTASDTNYLMEISGESINFRRAYTSPLPSSPVYPLSKQAVKLFVSKEDEYSSPIGNLMQPYEDVEIVVDLERMIHYHTGVFAFTGSGKSNLTSLIIRKAIKAIKDLKVVIFDVASEYFSNLADIVYSNSIIYIKEPIIGESIDEKAEDFLRKQVIPPSLESVKDKMGEIVKSLIINDKIKYFKPEYDETEYISSYSSLIEQLTEIGNDSRSKQNRYLASAIINMLYSYMSKKGIGEEEIIDDKIKPFLEEVKAEIEKMKLGYNNAVVNLINSLNYYVESSKDKGKREYEKISDIIREVMEGNSRIFIFQSSSIEDLRKTASKFIESCMRYRKRSFSLKPKILMVFDEAQEFIPSKNTEEDYTAQSNRAVEFLLRHGRKYNLHAWISSQRLAYLNTNALQQLHTYFVSIMPRPYDRQLIGDTFAIDDAFLERTMTFSNGDWLLVSFKATNNQNVPVFFHAYNNELEVIEGLERITSKNYYIKGER